MAVNEKIKSIGNELTLDLDLDKQQISGLFALAQTIQNILLTEPGTYPNLPSLGIGITSEVMEFIDDTTIESLKDRITKQIEEFIPIDNEINVFVTTENINKLDSRKFLLVGFSIQEEITSNEKKPTLFSIVFAQDKKKNLFSKIII